MALEHYKTQVLLLHSQQSTLDALSAGFNDRYSVHVATSGTEALNTLHDTPVHVIICAQDLPGMSGLEAIREARKRSPDTIGILLAGSNKGDGLEALVSDKEVFQIVRGQIRPSELIEMIESATKQARLMALAESANDQSADPDATSEHIVMETSEHGASIVSDGTGAFPALDPQRISAGAGLGARDVDVLILSKDEEFLATIKDSVRGLHNIHHSLTPAKAEEIARKHKIGVLVTDAAMVGSEVESLTQQLRGCVPRLVAIVAGRRDDGEMLMDLINRGHVYRFLLKPVSPGRARLAIEASVKHHLEASDSAFKSKPQPATQVSNTKPKPKPKPKPKRKPVQPTAQKRPAPVAPPKPASQASTLKQSPRPARQKPAAVAKPKPVARVNGPNSAAAPAANKKPSPAPAKPAKPVTPPQAAKDVRPAASVPRKPAARTQQKPAHNAQTPPTRKSSPNPRPAPPRPAPERKIAPTISSSPLDDVELEVDLDGSFIGKRKPATGLEPGFDDGRSFTDTMTDFTDTMTDIAATLGKTISGATHSAAGSATGLARSSGAAMAGMAGKFPGNLLSTKTMGIGVAAIAAVAVGGWMLTGDDSATGDSAVITSTVTQAATPDASRTVTPPTNTPRSAEQLTPSPTPEITQPAALTEASLPVSAALQAARTARDQEQLIFPAGDNAIELYVLALRANPDDPVVRQEFDDIVNRVLALAEGAMLASDAEEAAAALEKVAVADAENPRLTFLRAQLKQQQVREASDLARVAIRDERFGDAATLVSQARDITGADSVEVNLLAQELVAAQNAQQAAEIITLANERLESGDLTAPQNDNAKYLFEQALEVDQENLAAQQGLIAVASKLVLQSREAIDAGQLDLAATLLQDAGAIDPESAELAASTAALNSAREAGAVAAQQAEAERLAALERQRAAELEQQAELERQAEAERLAELERQTELERQAEAERLAELERQVDAERQLAAQSQAEQERLAELQRQTDLQAAADRQAETDRLAEQERQAAAAMQAEADRIAVEDRAIVQAEEDRLRTEKDASAAAASSPLGVAGSRVARTTTPTISGGNAVQRTVTAPLQLPSAPPLPNNSTPNTAPSSEDLSASTTTTPDSTVPSTPPPSPARVAPAPSATTFALPGSGSSKPAGNVPNTRAQQASIINQRTFSGSTPGSAAGALTETEMVPVSRLKRTSYVAPKYPRVAQRRSITGSVELAFTVTIDGTVRSASVVRSEPSDTFDEAALNAIEKWRFEPIIENGVAVEKRTAVRLAFDLQE